ncbi:hypothetical protein AB9E14_08410, partial [Rhizobium leguminosarum]|uniref:hypothetical protein n=1 Tax=Rhizobium leguminosarum TaxID=384 RepID=UPI003F9DD2E6
SLAMLAGLLYSPLFILYDVALSIGATYLLHPPDLVKVGDDVLFQMADIAERLNNPANPMPSLLVTWINRLNRDVADLADRRRDYGRRCKDCRGAGAGQNHID